MATGRIRRHTMDFSAEREKFISEKVQLFNEGHLSIRELLDDTFDQGRYAYEKEQQFDELFELKGDVLRMIGQRLQGVILLHYTDEQFKILIGETVHIIKEINKITLDDME